MTLNKDFRVIDDVDMSLDFVRTLNQGQLPRGFGDWLYKRMLNQKQRAGIPAEATETNGFVLEDSENIGNVFFADIRMDGFSVTATYDPEREELTGPMPANLDGLSLGAMQNYIKRIFIGDAASDKRERNGLYIIADEVTSTDPNLVLRKVPKWANKGKLTFIKYGTYAGQAAEWTAVNKIADTYKGSEPWEQAKSELFSIVLNADGIYTTNLAGGTVSADGYTMSGLGALPVANGYTPTNNRPVLLVGQTDKKQNGYWIISNKDAGSLSRLSWHNLPEKVKRNHLVVIAGGNETYKNTIWRAQAATEGIDYLATDVDYEQVGGGTASSSPVDRDALCVLDFAEGAGSTAENTSIYAPGIGMGGTLVGAAPASWWQSGGPTGQYIAIPPGEYVSISEALHYMMDKYEWGLEMYFSTSAVGTRLFQRCHSAENWESGARYLYLNGSGKPQMEIWGDTILDGPGGSTDPEWSDSDALNDSAWHKVELFCSLIPNTSHVTLNAHVNDVNMGGKYIDAIRDHAAGHVLRIGSTSNTATLNIAGFKLRDYSKR